MAVGAGEKPVGKEPACIGSAIESLADYLSGPGRAHGEDSYGGARILLFKTEGLLEREKVVRIENGGQDGPVDRSFRRHGILAYVPGVRNLFGEDNDVVFHFIQVLVNSPQR